MIKLKRAYEPAAAADGFRVLVERLWPWGVSKAEAALDLWLKEVAPSPGLRQWFSHDPENGENFAGATGLNWPSEETPSGCLKPGPEKAISPWFTAPAMKSTMAKWP